MKDQRNSPRREYRDDADNPYPWDGGPGYTCSRCGEGGLGEQGHYTIDINGEWKFLCSPEFKSAWRKK